MSDRRISRRAFLGLLAGGAVAAAAGTGVAGAYRFVVEPIDARLDGLRAPVTVAWLADMHFGPWVRAGSVAAWVEAALDLAPDLIVLGGDQVDHRVGDDLDPLLTQLSRLRAPLGVFAVRGNHEYARFSAPGDLEAFERDLAAVGVTTLMNRGVQLRDDLYLGGLDNGRVGPRRAQSTFAARGPGSACLFAAHQPDALPVVPVEVGLTLCGHTHGGQVRLPWVGSLVTRTQLGLAYEAGWVRAPALGYVSRGLGVVHVPLRVNCPAELTVARLMPA